MVETPTAAIFEPTALEDPDATLNGRKEAAGKPVEPELFVKQPLVTAKLRTAMKHLRARAGFWAPFRGITIYLVYQFCFVSLTSLLVNIHVIPQVIAPILAAVALARLRMGWTWIVISDPSPKFWFRRLPSWKLWKKIALPTIVVAICEQVTVQLPKALWLAFGMGRFNDPQKVADLNDAERKAFVLKGLAVLALGLFSAVAILIPATVSLIRVHGSLLPEEEETIVPFDRTFGGRVVPSIVGGSGVIGMLDAWKTFDWNSRIRLLKLYLKVIALQFITALVYFAILIAIVKLTMGDAIKAYITAGRQ